MMAAKMISMNEDEFQTAVRELAREEMENRKTRRKGKQKKEKELEYSKAITNSAWVFYALTWVVAVVSWFWLREIPTELIGFSTAFTAVAQVAYTGKSGYENGVIFENNYDPNYQGGDWQNGV